MDLDAVIDSIKAANAINSLENLSFVLEADKLVLKRGETVFVTPNTNFISLNDDKAVVQVAPRPSGGPNGVGALHSREQPRTSPSGRTSAAITISG